MKYFRFMRTTFFFLNVCALEGNLSNPPRLFDVESVPAGSLNASLAVLVYILVVFPK